MADFKLNFRHHSFGAPHTNFKRTYLNVWVCHIKVSRNLLEQFGNKRLTRRITFSGFPAPRPFRYASLQFLPRGKSNNTSRTKFKVQALPRSQISSCCILENNLLKSQIKMKVPTYFSPLYIIFPTKRWKCVPVLMANIWQYDPLIATPPHPPNKFNL